MYNNKTGNNIQTKYHKNNSLKAIINTLFKKHQVFLKNVMNNVLVMKGEISTFFTSHGHPHSAPSIHDKAAAATPNVCYVHFCLILT
jgi:hypothetical protein